MVSKRMVALCDILGFSNLLYSHDLGVVSKIFNDYRSLLYFCLHQDFPESKDNTATIPSHSDLMAQNRVGFAWFSDTILIYSLSDSDEDCRRVLETVAWLIFFGIFKGHYRMRAGVSYGDCYIDTENMQYIGKPIVEAYNLEKNQNWSGAALTAEAINRLPKWVKRDLPFVWYLTKYSVPLKDESENNGYAINWTAGVHRPLKMNWSPSEENPSPEIISSQPDVVKKWENTRAFHHSVCIHCRGMSDKLPENLVKIVKQRLGPNQWIHQV